MTATCPFIDSGFFIGIIASVITVVLLYIFREITLFWVLSGVRGFYKEIYNKTETGYREDSYFRVRQPLWNIFRPYDYIIIEQYCESRGSWSSKIIVSLQSIYVGNGIFKYKTRKAWGGHSIIMNKKAGLIHIDAISKSSKGKDDYIIEKKTKAVKMAYDKRYPKK